MKDIKFIDCPYCKKHIPTNSNFCYLCGEPISDEAKRAEDLKTRQAQLDILGSIVMSVKSPEDKQILSDLLATFHED